VQDAYLRAIRHFGSVRGGEGRAWLLMIIRNLCYDSMRRKNVRDRTTSFDEEQHNTCPAATSDPESTLLRKEHAELEALAFGSGLTVLPDTSSLV